MNDDPLALGGVPSDFNSLAEDYARFRTSYSDTLFDEILEYAHVPAGGRILDLACGTGLGLVPYMRRGFALCGADIAEAMMAQAATALPAGAPVELVVGRAEALPFPDASFDLVSCAQSFHWFEPNAAFAQCARVLRPTGALAIFWKHAARTDVMTLECEQLIREWMGDAAAIASRDHAKEHEAGWPIFWRYVARRGMPPAPGHLFVDGEERVVEFSFERSADEFVGYQRSREKIRTVLGGRREEFLSELDRRMQALAPGPSRIRQTQVQYAFLARRRAS